MGGGGKECPPTRVGALFVTLPPPRRCHHMDAEAYKECLDAYLEGLIAGGSESARPATTFPTITGTAAPPPSPPRPVSTVVRRGQGPPLPARIPPCSVRCLIAKLGCMQFVGGPGATSSRGSRRRGQDGAALAENLSNVAALLLLRHPVEKTPSSLAT